MIKVNFNTYANYVTDSVYQWDINRDLVINGLNLLVAPEIHFANANMDKAIVKQSTLSGGVVRVRIPNSLLQSALTIKAYVGIYEGYTFKVIETIEIPVIAKERPTDYVIEGSDEEIYSFTSLENLINNTVMDFNNKLNQTREEFVSDVSDVTAELTSRLNQFLGGSGSTLYTRYDLTLGDDSFVDASTAGYVVTNGINAVLITHPLKIRSLSGSARMGNLFKIPEALMPLGRTTYELNSAWSLCFYEDVGNIMYDGAGNVALDLGGYMYFNYPLKNVVIHDLEDLKVDADGTVYQSGGELVRKHSREIGDLKNKLPNQIIDSKNGSIITITDSDDKPFRGLHVYGKSTQGDSPSPQYPQTVVNCENTEVSVLNRNIFGGEAFLNKFVEVTEGNVIKDTEKGTVYAVTTYLTKKILFDNFKENTQYTLILKASNPTAGGTSIRIEYTDGTRTQPSIMTVGTVTTLVIVSDANKTIAKLVGAEQAHTTYYYNECGLFEGVVSLEEFEAYNSQSLTIPYTLCGIPVSDAYIANYTDENGQMWCSDYVNCDRGGLVQRVYENVFDGSDDEQWMSFRNDDASINQFYIAVDCIHNQEQKYCYSNYYIAECFDKRESSHNICYTYNGGIAFNVNPNVATNLIEWREFLASTPVTVQYILAEPIEIPLSAEQIESFKALHSNYPNTTIMTNNGAGMKVEYVADTKRYIDNKFMALASLLV